MGMWMLILRTAQIEKENEEWFTVNGSPIRYSIREHALLSGLHCHDFPNNYEEIGSLDFIQQLFGTTRVTHKMVEEKFQTMKNCKKHRKRMAVLYFLSHVLKGNAKRGQDETAIDTFILRVVSKLDVCESFPWGRLTFYDCLEKMKSMVEKFDGGVVSKKGAALPSFIMPLEILAFEAIPSLGKEFRKPFGRANAGCPRMCKTTFKSSAMRGFSIQEINDALGDTKDITSILQPSGEEQHLLYGVVVDDYVVDPVVDGWKDRLDNGQIVFFEDLYNQDIEARKKKNEIVRQEEAVEEENTSLGEENTGLGEENTGLGEERGGPSGSAWEKRLEQIIVGRMEAMVKDLSDTIHDRIDGLELKMDVLELRLDDIQLSERGVVREGELPHVMYATYHDLPADVRADIGEDGVEDGVHLLAKVSTDLMEEDVGDARDGGEEAEETGGEEQPEKVSTDLMEEDVEDARDGGEISEKQTGGEEAEETGGEEAEETGGEELPESGGEEAEETGGEEKLKKPKPTYSELRKPPFEQKNLRSRNAAGGDKTEG